MYPVILTVHVVVCSLLILIVLIQSGRSGGFSNLMGGGGGDALFSTSGQQSGLRKITFVIAGIFMATSVALTLIASRSSSRSVLEQNYPALPPVAQPVQNPAEPGQNGSAPMNLSTQNPPDTEKSANTGDIKK